MKTAYISSFVYCKDTPTEQDVEDIKLLPFLKVKRLPISIQIKAICSIFGEEIFTGSIVEVKFKAPDGEVLVQYDWHLDEKMLKSSDGRVPDALVLNLTLASEIERAGIYTTEIFIDGTKLGEYKFHIMEM